MFNETQPLSSQSHCESNFSKQSFAPEKMKIWDATKYQFFDEDEHSSQKLLSKVNLSHF